MSQDAIARLVGPVIIVAFALAEISTSVGTWPRRLPSSELARRELADRLTPRLRRLIRAMGWMTIGLLGILPSVFVLRLPMLVALLPLGLSMFDGVHATSGADSSWLRRVKGSALFARRMTAMVGTASLVVALLDPHFWWLFAAAALLFAGAQAHGTVARAADDVLDLASPVLATN